jgi:hypothetical protein
MSIEIKEYEGFKPEVKKSTKPVKGSKDSNNNKGSKK